MQTKVTSRNSQKKISKVKDSSRSYFKFCFQQDFFLRPLSKLIGFFILAFQEYQRLKLKYNVGVIAREDISFDTKAEQNERNVW